jgi:mannosyltransferase OCH1-like enzyme
MIPKIIHQMGPANQDSWPYVWVKGHEMVKDVFKDFHVILWKNEDMYPTIKKHFPEYNKLVNDLPGITKCDFFRNVLMYLYGGVYLDLDFLVYDNFFNKLKINKPTIIEGMYKKERKEDVQNNFLASPAKDKVWLNVMKECKNNFYNMDRKEQWYLQVMKISSSLFFTNYVKKFPNHFNILPRDPYNLTPDECKKINYKIPCQHIGTGCWQ